MLPGAFWRAIECNNYVIDWFTNFCDLRWHQKRIPEEWRIANIACIFKKGNTSLPNNYRPISLVTVGYKIFASILLNRLRDGGTQKKIWSTKFGCKQSIDTSEILFLVRQIIETTWVKKDGSNILLALDWAKVFDCISSDVLMGVFQRFGVPQIMVSMISELCVEPLH